jgi:hypothetical protein
MAAHDSLGDQFGPHMSMVAEAVRRDTAKQHGVEHSGPGAPQVTKVELPDERRAAYHPQASHHVSVRYETPTTTHTHVYGVNESNEYMHNHTHVHEMHTQVSPATGRPNTRTTFKAG